MNSPSRHEININIKAKAGLIIIKCINFNNRIRIDDQGTNTKAANMTI